MGKRAARPCAHCATAAAHGQYDSLCLIRAPTQLRPSAPRLSPTWATLPVAVLMQRKADRVTAPTIHIPVR
jgi:hypothetical protein